MKILFIQTGGTIDKDYPKQSKGYAFEITEPAVKQILIKINPSFEYEVISLLKKDSLDLTPKDKKKIFETCENADTDKIIITHGTDTLLETAKFLSVVKNKTIILTGAFKPEKFKDSDADFNIGTAVGGANVLGYGVFVAIKGRIYKFDKVKRNKKTSNFEDL